MTTAEMANQLRLTAATTLDEREVHGAIVSDLISDVLANAEPNDVWVTIQTHRNVAAVAATLGLAAVVITASRRPDEGLLQLATHELVAVLLTDQDSYTVAGKLYEMGLR